MKVPQKRKLAFWQKMQREDGLSATLPLLSFSDRDSSGKPYLVQAYPPRARKCDILATSRVRYIIPYTESGLLFGQ